MRRGRFDRSCPTQLHHPIIGRLLPKQVNLLLRSSGRWRRRTISPCAGVATAIAAPTASRSAASGEHQAGGRDDSYRAASHLPGLQPTRFCHAMHRVSPPHVSRDHKGHPNVFVQWLRLSALHLAQPVAHSSEPLIQLLRFRDTAEALQDGGMH